MFIIGLELQPSRLWALRRTVFGLGCAEVGVCCLLLSAMAWSTGLPPVTATIVGFGLSLSSTPLVLQVLVERKEIQAQHGRSAFGILLFQDLAVLPVLTVLPLLAGSDSSVHSQGSTWLELGKLVTVLAAVIIGGRLLLRPLLRIVAQTRVSEAFTAAGLLTIVLTALVVQKAGLSMAFGAFLAGVLLADSEFRHQLEADIDPFKGLLLGLFFIAVGMSANLGVLWSRPLALLGVTCAFMITKIAAVSWLARMTRHRRDAAWRLAFTLPAGGEFAFVLFTLAVRQRLLDQATADLLVLAVTLSMIVAPTACCKPGWNPRMCSPTMRSRTMQAESSSPALAASDKLSHACCEPNIYILPRSTRTRRRWTLCAGSATRCFMAMPRAWTCCVLPALSTPKYLSWPSTTSKRRYRLPLCSGNIIRV
jgi:Kef-type K+ transport system membrane component KefB